MKIHLTLGLMLIAQINAMDWRPRYQFRRFNPLDSKARLIDKSRLSYSLHQEIQNNDPIQVKVATIKEILDKGADVNARDSNGNTPL